MSRIDRLKVGASRMAARVSEFRERAERERAERERVARQREDEQAEELSPSSKPQEPPQKPSPDAVIPWGMRVAAEAGWRLLVLAGVIWVLVQVIGAISLLIVAFSAGLLITALLQPSVSRLKRLGLGRGLSTAISFVGGFAVMGLIGWFVVWQVIENQEDLVKQVQSGVDELRTWILNSPFQVTDEQLNDLADNLNSWIGEHSQELTNAGLEGATLVVQFLTGAALAAFVCLFLLYDGRRIWEWTLNFVPRPAREGVAGAGPRAWVTLTGYVRGTVIVAFIDAVGIGLGIYLLGVPLAVPLAVIVFLFAFVPIVGALVSGALAVVVAFVTNGLVTALLALGVVLIVQQIEGNILQPFILGRLVRVHPLGVVLAVTGGSLLAGIPGAVVAVPLVAVSNTVITYLRAYSDQRDQHHGHHGHHGATLADASPAVPPRIPGEGPKAGATAVTVLEREDDGTPSPDRPSESGEEPGGSRGSGGDQPRDGDRPSGSQ
ncbi:AI-2E family transporter [Streptomyces sp. 549]|uniref:AI-2E family transporter n=1 Tax=Streptomyces sp. 549 TaxID=3049076 RepID=UPI0024C45A5C|nr:AI-2E family transporter [Streptomyces sp. 549]MDK1476602.1 AI-2E family transporter [Streptomyces sp. 549]